MQGVREAAAYPYNLRQKGANNMQSARKMVAYPYNLRQKRGW